MLLGKLVDALKTTTTTTKEEEDDEQKKEIIISGTAVLMKKNVLDLNDFNASVVDNLSDFLGHKVSIQFVSSALPQQDSSSNSGNNDGGNA